MSNLQLRKAERKQARLRIGLFGPSGAGKTMSALRLARGLAPWEKIAMIDTESGSGDLYSHMGPYNILQLTAPFTPEKYIEAIEACKEAGMEVIIVDSITHEWSGAGGILELADQLSVASKNSFGVWMKLTPRHNRFIDSLLQSPAHVICCTRSKQDYVLNQVEKNGKTINVPEKVGLKAVTREGFEYEMTIAFDLAINHFATTSKDRTGQFMGKPEFIITEEVGQTLKEWNQTGKADVLWQKQEIMRHLKRLGYETKDGDKIRADILNATALELVDNNYQAIIDILQDMQERAMEEAVAETQVIQIEADVTQAEKYEAAVETEIAPTETPAPASQPKIGLIKSLLKQREGVEDDDTVMAFLSMELEREINNFSEVSGIEASKILEGLMKKK